MKKKLLFGTLLLSIISYSQNRLSFSYDNAGNQTTRLLCYGCLAKPSKEIKETEAITEEDLEKFYPEDLISYYPNPVKEELYLSWKTVDTNNLSSISVFSMLGQQLVTFQASKNNNQIIAFQNYPAGVYLVLLSYSNGEEETIKIIKK